ncbi:hypothetical protein C8J56DRAFT_1165004 [Mycena floridula]|nr:hypothetical protein C8J56DRAFT_1165004 [Mycena floridula]
MPSFSLIRRFGKQHKPRIDLPVSSGLVEQHVGHAMLENSHSRIKQQSEAGNVFSGTRADNSHTLTSGEVALSQRIEGVSMGNINAPVMSNNQVNITNYYGAQGHSDARDIYLEEEIESYLEENNVWRTRYKGKIMASSIANMSIWSYRGETAGEALEKAYEIYASLPRHPNILQLYGICCSTQLTALAFHGALYVMDRRDYYKSLPSSQWITHYRKLFQQNESAHSMLEAHNLQGFHLRGSDVDETGKLVIAQFFPGSSDNSAFDTRIWMAFETNTFIKEDLLDYYKFLFDMMQWSFDRTFNLGTAAPFQFSHPEVNLPVYSLPGNKIVHEMDITVKETGIVLTLLTNMAIRCCIPTAQIPTFSIYEYMSIFEQNGEALFPTWACQANYLVHDLPINIIDLQTAQNIRILGELD